MTNLDIDTTKVDPDLFELPIERISVSGGNSSFYNLKLKQEISQGIKFSKCADNHYIGKDLTGSENEAQFYEEVHQLLESDQFEQDRERGLEDLLKFSFEYLGVFSGYWIDEGNGADRNDIEVMVLQNLRSSCESLRMIDLKIGRQTASANWKGKSRRKSFLQKQLDRRTNSVREGFRMEGIDNPPLCLQSRDATVGSNSIRASAMRKTKYDRSMLQNYSASMILTFFTDLHPNLDNDTSKNMMVSEVSEIVLHELVKKMCRLAVACHALHASDIPQKWVGSSLALGFDCANENPPRTKEALAQLRDSVIVKIFDWGKSELNTTSKHDALSENEKKDRKRFWQYYTDGVDMLSWYTARLYWHRYSNDGSWATVTFTVFDFDAGSKDDTIGRATIDLVDDDVLRTCQLTYRGKQSLFFKRNTGVLTYSTKWIPVQSDDNGNNDDNDDASPLHPRLKGVWRVFVKCAEKLANRDFLDKSDPYCVVKLTSSDGLHNFEQVTATKHNNLNPVWDEYFDFPIVTNPDSLEEVLGEANIITPYDEDEDITMNELFGQTDSEFRDGTKIGIDNKAIREWKKRLNADALDDWLTRLEDDLELEDD